MLSRPPQPPGDIKLGPPPPKIAVTRSLHHSHHLCSTRAGRSHPQIPFWAPANAFMHQKQAAAARPGLPALGLRPPRHPKGGSAAPRHPPTPKERIPRHRLPQNGARRAERRDTGLVLHPATATSPRSGCFPHHMLAPGAQAPGSLLTSVPQFPPGEQQEGFQHQPAWQRNPKPGAKHFGG